jgi:hypothetical protein
VGLLIGRLQIEPFLGAGVLLCVAVMAATLPSRPLAPPARAARGSRAAGVQATAPVQASPLRVTLVISPAALGRNDMTVTLLQPAGQGRWRPESDGQVRLKVTMAAMPTMGTATAETTMIGGGRYRGSADIVMGGDWHLDVLVRTPADPQDYYQAPFTLTAGLYGQPPSLQPWASAPVPGSPPSAPAPAPTPTVQGSTAAPHSLPVAAGSWRGTVRVAPAAYGPNRFTVQLANRAGRPSPDHAVSVLLTSLEMHMGTIRLEARRTAAGQFTATGS